MSAAGLGLGLGIGVTDGAALPSREAAGALQQVPKLPCACESPSCTATIAQTTSLCSACSSGAPAEHAAAFASAIAASKLGLAEQLSTSIGTCKDVVLSRDSEGRTALHYAAGYGHEECVDLLLSGGADARARDATGDVPLHFAAIHGHPMCAYNITKVCSV